MHKIIFTLFVFIFGVIHGLAEDAPISSIWPADTEGVDATRPTELAENAKWFIAEVYNPNLRLFPAEKGEPHKRPAMIICPGGGYHIQAFEHEGNHVAKRFAEEGVTCFVLQYRMPRQATNKNMHPVPVSDALRAIQYIRYHAVKYQIDPDKIGILGFSAGGHLAASAATLYDKHAVNIGDGDKVSQVSARPDFAVMCYPVITSNPKLRHGCIMGLLPHGTKQQEIDKISCERNVTKATPPCFFMHAKDDAAVKPENSMLMHEALKKVGVQTELKLYEQGAHGFGLGRKGQDSEQWPVALTEWLKEMQFIVNR